MRAFHLILAIAALLTPLSVHSLSVQQLQAVAVAGETTPPRRSYSSTPRSVEIPTRPLSGLWRNKPANVRVGFAGNSSAQTPYAQLQSPATASATAPQGDRRNLRNRLHLKIRTPLGWVRVRLAS